MERLAVKLDFSVKEHDAKKRLNAMRRKAEREIFDVENYHHVLAREKVDAVSPSSLTIAAFDQAEGRRAEPDLQVL